MTLPFLYVLVPFLLALPSFPVPSSGIVSTSGFLDYKIKYANALFQDEQKGIKNRSQQGQALKHYYKSGKPWLENKIKQR